MAACKIDRDVLNEFTLQNMNDIALSFFASACGKNRGAWVLDPPDGNTYSCLSFPPNFAELAGVNVDKKVSKKLVDANSINKLYLAGNITSSETVDLLDFLVQSVYKSTPDTDTMPYACDFSGLAELVDDSAPVETPFELPIRAVTLAGVFTSAPWATGGKELSLEEAEGYYTATDFQQMATLGVNTVQIPVPASAFSSGGSEVFSALKDILKLISDEGLKAILALESTAEEQDDVVVATAFAAKHSTVLGVIIPPTPQSALSAVVAAIRVKAPTLPLFFPLHGGDLIEIQSIDPLVFGALTMGHTETVADIASSSSREDRSKMFYHESIACVARAPVEYSETIKKVPVFVSSGFDLAIDNCVLYNATEFQNYGQCDRFDETVDSNWWRDHRESFAARQLYAYEQGLGWSFATWKLYPGDEVGAAAGIIDEPAKLLALKNVVAAGLFPNLAALVTQACLNPPANDFVLGDDTLAPTPGPPPDCGNGWWNYSTAKCDYWIPPVTPAPTPAPTIACPEITPIAPTGEGGLFSFSSAGVGIVGAILGAIIATFVGNKRNRRTEGFEQLPN